jgi:predicted nuclease of predicted toxin-antitoxin system
MRILLDACVPRRLRDHLHGHGVRTAFDMGWGDLDNGDLLDAMTGQFEAFITVDKRLPHEQQVTTRPFGVVVLRARSNRLHDLVPLVPEILTVLSTLGPGEVKEVTG